MRGLGFSRGFLLLVVIAISLLFFSMIRSFLMSILLAGIFSGLARPLYLRLLRGFRGRRAQASAMTLLVGLLVVVLPLFGFLGIVVAQAVRVTQTAAPTVSALLDRTDELPALLARMPFADQIAPYREQILTKTGVLAAGVGGFLVSKLSSTTGWTLTFLFQFFVMLYTMFFFLKDGPKLLDRILYYLPLTPEDEDRLLERFLSVARATLKGTLVIGVLQGGLAGIGFWVAGIPQSVFWGTLMTMLSIIPGIGTGLVWLPAGIYLVATGHTVAGILLMVFCGLVVGSIDNLLRPRLVGHDTRMHELFIFLGTVGGILLFGVAGFIVGPIVTALFITAWEIYGVAFREYLPVRGGTTEENTEEA